MKLGTKPDTFDKVDKGILCHKMKRMGIHGKLGIWLHNFLTNRNQAVIANGIKSRISEIRSGVPQGTVLGPLLFLILINDIDQDITNSSVHLFADDTRISKVIKNQENLTELQEDLKTLYDWEKSNNMEFNGTKFEVLRCGPNRELKENEYKTPNEDNIDRK